MKAIEPLMILILVFICTGFPFNSIANEIDDGNIDFSKKSYNLATAHYLKYLSKSPDSDGYIAYRIGLCYYLSGNQEKAVMYFKSAKEKNPNVSKQMSFSMPSVGMEPTLLMGDQIFVDNEHYNYTNVGRNDVVVIENPKQKGNLLIKRIIGLPGEKFEIKNNVIFIGSAKFEDKYGAFYPSNYERAVIIKDIAPITIPKDKYYVLGDNRNNTFDSRHFGLVAKQLVKGKVLAVYGSIDISQKPLRIRQDRAGIIIQ